MRIVLVDHHDSFTWNLAHLFGALLGGLPEVVESDALDVGALAAVPPDLVLLGPGPGHPADPAAARSLALIAALRGRAPLFGVCLGLQLLAVAAGGRVVRAAQPMHGKGSAIVHDGKRLFAGLPPRVPMMRYHSLVAERATLPAALQVVASSETGEVMALEEPAARACAVQFHPESIGSPLGAKLAANVIEWARAGRWREA